MADASVFLSFLVSPFKLIRILKQARDPEINAPEHTLEWFKSSKGAEAYRKANTVQKKALFFDEYLERLSKKKTENEQLSFITRYRFAFLIAHRIAGSSLPYGQYPEILSEDENPLIRAFMIVPSDKYSEILTSVVLRNLQPEKDIDLECWIDDYREPFKNLTELASDRSNRDFYLLEREAIFRFQRQLNTQLNRKWMS